MALEISRRLDKPAMSCGIVFAGLSVSSFVCYVVAKRQLGALAHVNELGLVGFFSGGWACLLVSVGLLANCTKKVGHLADNVAEVAKLQRRQEIVSSLPNAKCGNKVTTHPMPKRIVTVNDIKHYRYLRFGHNHLNSPRIIK